MLFFVLEKKSYPSKVIFHFHFVRTKKIESKLNYKVFFFQEDNINVYKKA